MIQTHAPLLSEVEDRLRSAKSISLFLDFDGTLAPISSDPTVPRLDPETASTLTLLSSHESLRITIISGRAVEDLYSRIRLEGLIYAGNHGLEIFGHGFRFVEQLASGRRDKLERLCEELATELSPYAGASVEWKGLTASAHFRQAAEADWDAIERTVHAVVARYGDLFRAYPGRKVFDIVPRTNWHKGAAVQWINSHLNEPDLLTIYLGDDTSDEDAFSVLPDAITVRVGNVPVTCARFQFSGPVEVHDFLRWLAGRVR